MKSYTVCNSLQVSLDEFSLGINGNQMKRMYHLFNPFYLISLYN